MDFGAPARYPDQSSPNFLSTGIAATIPPGTEDRMKKATPEHVGVAESSGLTNDEAWVPMAAFLETMQEAASGVDEYLCVRYWNTPMARLTGVCSEEAINRPLFSLLPRDFERHLGTGLKQLFQRQTADNEKRLEMVEGKFSQRHGNCEFFDFAYRMRVLPTKDNRELAIITLRATSEGRNRHAPQEPFGMLGKLSVGIVQELANPLDTICSRIDRILAFTGNQSDQRLEGELHRIITEVYQISYLINNVLVLSRSDVSNFVQVNINELILEATKFVEHTLNRKLAFTTALQTDLPLVPGDPILLQSVFQNILRYAVEAAGEDAVPKIQTSLVELSPARISLPPAVPSKNGRAGRNRSQSDLEKKESWRQVVVRIEDRGPVLAPNILAQLFEPLFASKQFGIGVGLGLLISKKIIESHRGQLQVSSEPGRGTVFTITFRV